MYRESLSPAMLELKVENGNASASGFNFEAYACKSAQLQLI
jgi:hypothetical protein